MKIKIRYRVLILAFIAVIFLTVGLHQYHNDPPSETDTVPRSIPTSPGSDAGSDAYYFNSYSQFGIHQQMLEDKVRTTTYRDAIYKNSHLFKGKVVLDVGCGTGILSLFAAKAGAKRVIGVDMSKMAVYAEKIVADNKLSDVITIIQGRLEEIVLPDGINKVDIIISEWMGYALLFESMLNSVLFARDKWLVPNGLIFPDRAIFYINAIEDLTYEDSANFWNEVYGFDMSAIRNAVTEENPTQPVIQAAYPRQIMSNSYILKDINLYIVTVPELSFKVPFILKMNRDGHFIAMLTYFDIEFTKSASKIGFSTGPSAKSTHWYQTLFYLKRSYRITKGAIISGDFEMKPDKIKNRNLDIKMDIAIYGDAGTTEHSLYYDMWP